LQRKLTQRLQTIFGNGIKGLGRLVLLSRPRQDDKAINFHGRASLPGSAPEACQNGRKAGFGRGWDAFGRQGWPADRKLAKPDQAAFPAMRQMQ
jgi:hypothetical protein